MNTGLAGGDLLVLACYFAGLTALGVWCARRTRNSEHFMAAGRAMPGWALALTLFGSYVSSISFLAQPGKSFADNWNPFVFCFALPFFGRDWRAGLCRVLRLSPARSRHTGTFCRGFGAWARTYGTVCLILLQVTRTLRRQLPRGARARAGLQP